MCYLLATQTICVNLYIKMLWDRCVTAVSFCQPALQLTAVSWCCDLSTIMGRAALKLIVRKLYVLSQHVAVQNQHLEAQVELLEADLAGHHNADSTPGSPRGTTESLQADNARLQHQVYTSLWFILFTLVDFGFKPPVHVVSANWVHRSSKTSCPSCFQDDQTRNLHLQGCCCVFVCSNATFAAICWLPFLCSRGETSDKHLC